MLSLRSIKEELRRSGIFPFFIAFVFSFWALTGVLPIFEQDVTVNIRSLGQRNSLSLGTEVWVVKLPKFNLSKVPRGWENREGVLVSFSGIGQPAEIAFHAVFSKSDEIIINKHPYSGIVEIEVEHNVKQYDLYSATSDQIRIPLSGTVRINHVKLIKSAVFFLIAYLAIVKLFIVFKTNGYIHEESKNTGYLARLDHLRFFAATLVILYHYFHDIIGLTYWGGKSTVIFG